MQPSAHELCHFLPSLALFLLQEQGDAEVALGCAQCGVWANLGVENPGGKARMELGQLWGDSSVPGEVQSKLGQACERFEGLIKSQIVPVRNLK